jgi:farnesyl-diphosphate farnesyltransferase
MTADRAERYQNLILGGVSRTFALTIPQLPASLRSVITNAYLLCRIADTIEDEPALTTGEKERFHARFTAVVGGSDEADAFARELTPRLARGRSLPAEVDLVSHTPLVMEMTRRFGSAEQRALARCVAIMCEGMPRFERDASVAGLADLTELGEYCYVVAGVVGETLTDLFCAHVNGLERHRQAMAERCVSFGQGLQMTNILKDFWEDHDRGACWLPRALLARHGVQLAGLRRDAIPRGFHDAYRELIALTHGHLCHALDYTLLIPPSETGIRRFCLIAIGLAMRTLRSIFEHPGFTAGSEVKVSRQVVANTVIATRLFAGHDRALRRWFARLAEDLPLEVVAPGRAGRPGAALRRAAASGQRLGVDA